MPNTPDFDSCTNGTETTLLPVSPFLALQYHFGMLLGVDDFEVSQAYPRGKIRLHNAWLHRDGVIWGFNVFFNQRQELTVDPGLALDAAGHELHLDRQACLDIGKWYATHLDDPVLQEVVADVFAGEFATSGQKTFTAYVVAKFKACLTRPVPAIADPCDGISTDTAFSRAFETVELLLKPGPAPRQPFHVPYHRLRLLFALIDPVVGDSVDAEVVARRDAILALPGEEQPAAYLVAFREYAALDTLDLKPQESPTSIFPEDPSEVVLGEIRDIIVEPHGQDAWKFVSADPPSPDITVRRTLVATSTIQELLCGPLFSLEAAPPDVDEDEDTPPETPPAPDPDAPLDDLPDALPSGPPTSDAGGPRVLPESVQVNGKVVTFTTTAPLAEASVEPRAFSVTSFEDNGWQVLNVRTSKFDADTNTVRLSLHRKPEGVPVRLIAEGTGPHPLLGANLVPLAGAVGGPPGTEMNGHDFVHMWTA
jgi:hypothetical protein